MMADLLALSKRIANHVEDRAETMGLRVTLCVLDVHGNLVLKERMTGAPLVSLEMAERKAYTSALLGLTTRAVAEASEPGGPLAGITAVSGGRFTAFAGGVPLVVEGELIGGAGVSGGTAAEDAEIVESALQHLSRQQSGQAERGAMQ